jgi:ABC-type transport system substrate-binding protein
MEAAGFDYSDLAMDATDEAAVCGSDCFFTLTVLSPNTNPARNAWADLVVAALPFIGIGVDEHVSTGWEEIIPRTFGSDVMPPTHAEGGFDLFFVGYSWGLDWDPSGLYTEGGLCGTGDCGNFYNYQNATVEQMIVDYTSELNFDTRVQKVQDLQKALKDDLPVIALIYPTSHWGWSADIEGIDDVLISTAGLNWGMVSKTGWTASEGGELVARGEIGPDPSFLNASSFVALGFSLTLIAVIAVRRRK